VEDSLQLSLSVLPRDFDTSDASLSLSLHFFTSSSVIPIFWLSST